LPSYHPAGPRRLTEQQQAELGHALARALPAVLEMVEASKGVSPSPSPEPYHDASPQL